MLEAEDLSFSYTSYDGKSSAELFSSISFSLKEHENLLILAEPGSGKTTLSLILSALIPSFFDGSLKGRILLDGEALPPAPQLLGKLSLVPQDASAFIITSSVEDEIAYPLESLGVEHGEMESRVDKAISEWGLERLRQASTDELSGGEKRRLVLAVSHVTDPAVVIYDESFDDLDISWMEVLRKRIEQRTHSSLVFASHYLPLFEGLFDRVLLLRDGRLEECGSLSFSLPAVHIARETVRKDELSARNIRFTHHRRSAGEVLDFHLQVDDFCVHSGEIVTLTGANGSGKSTFSRLLCGLDMPESGSFTLNGRAADQKLLSRSAGYMFQNPDFQIFLPTVRDELSFSLDYLSLSREEKEERLEKLCSLFSLKPDETASLMSYGDRKRLQAAIYYNLERPFYILDELDSALSYEQSLKLISLLASKGSGIILITHDPLFASAVRDRGYTLEEGVLHEE